MDYDRIAVFDSGVLAEFGRPTELLEDERGLLSQFVDAHGKVGHGACSCTLSFQGGRCSCTRFVLGFAPPRYMPRCFVSLLEGSWTLLR